MVSDRIYPELQVIHVPGVEHDRQLEVQIGEHLELDKIYPVSQISHPGAAVQLRQPVEQASYFLHLLTFVSIK